MMSLLQKVETLKLIERIKSSPLPVQIQDVYQWIERYSPAAARGLLSWTLPWFRPFSRGRWFRVSRLNDNEIEIIIPFETGNLDNQGGIHEAILFGAALEAASIFWWRHLQETPQIRILDASFKSVKKGSDELRLRAQLPEKSRELALHNLRKNSVARMDVPFKAFDKHETLVAEIEVKLEVNLIPQLGR